MHNVRLAVYLALGLAISTLSPWARRAQAESKYDLQADRVLTVEEQGRLDFLLVALGNPRGNRHRRAEYAREIGRKLAHKSAIPGLWQVVSNPKDNPTVRYWCLTAISQISDAATVIPLLVQALYSDQQDLRGRADEQLSKLAGHQNRPFEIREINPGAYSVTRAQLDVVAAAWRSWWERNRATFKFERIKVLVES